MDRSRQSKGGQARAEKLSAEERSKIAKAAAEARWRLPRTEHEGELEIPSVAPLNVANLEDGRRVMTSRAFLEALGRPWKGTYKRSSRPNFVDSPNLDEHLADGIDSYLEPVEFLNLRGQVVQGYRAELLPLVCRTYVNAREAGALTANQTSVAEKAGVLLEALQNIGIISLVDDATGFTKHRARSELLSILRAYISPELMPWTQRFPDTFYEELHRVRGWPYQPGNNARNGYIGKLTRALIYDPLPPGVREELERLNPYESGRKGRKYRHHQLLTEDIGNSHLEKQITSVTTLLRISDNWQEFLKHFNRAFPPRDGLFDLSSPPPEDASS